MRIDFENYDLETFSVKDGLFCNIPCKLINPKHIGTKFNQKNKIFRSSIWNLDGDLLSASFYKFVNFGENPENFPVPTNIDGWSFVEKIDGSCLIVDYINNTFSARTRGTFTYKGMENEEDFEYIFSKYPSIKEFVKNNTNYSLLLEIVTPNLKIVLNYGDEIDVFLTGCVNKENYTLLTQKELDNIANKLGIKRPPYCNFESINSLLEDVNNWKGIEGVVAYSSDGQHLLKIKSEWYLKLHAAKEKFQNIEAIIDVWFSFDRPKYLDFIKMLSEHYDYETMLICQSHASKICDANKVVDKIVWGMKLFVDQVLKPLPSRKDQAKKVLDSYGQTNRASFVFKLLDNNPLSNDELKKLLYQVLKN